MYDIIASASAKGDLEEIKAYLLTEFRNPQAVANLEAAIRRAQSLKDGLMKFKTRYNKGLLASVVAVAALGAVAEPIELRVRAAGDRRTVTVPSIGAWGMGYLEVW